MTSYKKVLSIRETMINMIYNYKHLSIKAKGKPAPRKVLGFSYIFN